MTRGPVIIAGALALLACQPSDPKTPAETPLPPPPAKARAVEVKPGEVVQHTLRFADAASHALDVESVMPTGGADPLVVSMAVWTPGSYLVREYSRHVEGLTAHTPAGDTLPVEKVAKNRWSVAAAGQQAIVLRYRLYGREMSVRTNWIESGMAVMNGAPTFMRPVGADRAHTVRLELPDGWADAVTGLDPHPDGAPHHYLAADYDELVDSPIIAGSPTVSPFEIGGVPYRLATLDLGPVDPELWDQAKAVSDLRRLVETQLRFWGSTPHARYDFLNVLAEAWGGLEHLDSTLVMTTRWVMRDRDAYTNWLRLMSHEFFHTWNVKRLRPKALGPFDYETENHTRSLWIAEGVTSYYDALLVRRAGLMTTDEFLETLSKKVKSLQTTPGRAVRSLSESSFDAWIKFYRRDENSVNTDVSYYTKGAIVAWLLDARIREASGRTLDDVLRIAYESHSGERGFTPEEFRQIVDQVAEAGLGPWLAHAVDGTGELDYAPALQHFGLRFKPAKDPPAGIDAQPPGGWMGLQWADAQGRATVSAVPRGTPAHAAKLNVDDELIALNDYRVTPGNIVKLLGYHRPEQTVEITVARRGRLLKLPLTLGETPLETWKLEPDPDATPEAVKRREAWLAGGRQ
jgi:predicted metalloprotease with PDZ domain